MLNQNNNTSRDKDRELRQGEEVNINIKTIGDIPIAYSHIKLPESKGNYELNKKNLREVLLQCLKLFNCIA